jgi:hypothetical protein
LMHTNRPKMIPANQNSLWRSVLLRQTTNSIRSEVIGMLVAGKWTWAKNRGMESNSRTKATPLYSKPPPPM